MYNLSEQSRDRLMMRATECLDEGAAIEDKIKMACNLYGLWGEHLEREPQILDLLGKLEGCLENSREVMLELGIVETCKHCDEEEGGSCCGAGLENKFDSLLLLINLLLGASLPERHHRPYSCYLLGDKGCVLKVRLVLCVDYLCPRILSALSHDELVRLQNILGDELLTGFKLYDALKRFMRNTRQKVQGTRQKVQGAGHGRTPRGRGETEKRRERQKPEGDGEKTVGSRQMAAERGQTTETKHL